MTVTDLRGGTLRRLTGPILAAAVAFGLAACGEEPKKAKKEIERPAKIMTVKRTARTFVREYPGRVLAPEWADLSFEVGGRLVVLKATEGENVKKGAVIAQLDPEDFRLEVTRKQARVNQSKVQLERLEKLVKQGNISRSRYDQGLRKYQVEVAELKLAKRNLAYTTITAPYDAVIAKRYLKNFRVVQRGEKIARIQDLRTLDISIRVPEDVVAVAGKTVNLKSAFATFEAVPDQRFPIKFKEASTEADPRTQTYEVKLSMKPPSNVRVTPGMTASVRLEFVAKGREGAAAFVVPVGAVASGAKGDFYVWVVDPKTRKVSRRDVKVGKLGKKTIEILSGLKEGERIVTAGVNYLREGNKVRPMAAPGQADKANTGDGAKKPVPAKTK